MDASLRRRWERVHERVRRAIQRAGRADEVTLLPVTKTRPVEDIRGLYDLGERRFGENRIPELLQKIPQLPADCEWHMIGHLQSNKAKEATGVGLLHSLDSASTALALEKAWARRSGKLDVLLEINSGEDQKLGLRTLDEVRRLAEVLEGCPHLNWTGLMTMAPFVHDEVVLRAAFARVYQWREHLQAEAAGRRLPVLSMGMSNDFEWAILEGSTLVRVGTAFFAGEDE